MRLEPREYDALAKWAARRGYMNRNGPTAGSLAKSLFLKAMPLFEACEFDPAKVAEAVAGIEGRRKKGERTG
ncbi:MAG: hypothetical protein KGL39_49715 [Patescibacteria group bacterium]|nr:hypothetical protein [Patescibacteria group bacterium]